MEGGAAWRLVATALTATARTATVRTAAEARQARVASRPARASDVEADVQDIAVLDDVGLPLEALQAATGRLAVRPGRGEVVPADHLAADEAPREVRVDRPCRVERGLAAPQRPGPRLLIAGGEEGDQVELLLEAPDD